MPRSPYSIIESYLILHCQAHAFEILPLRRNDLSSKRQIVVVIKNDEGAKTVATGQCMTEQNNYKSIAFILAYRVCQVRISSAKFSNTPIKTYVTGIEWLVQFVAIFTDIHTLCTQVTCIRRVWRERHRWWFGLLTCARTGMCSETNGVLYKRDKIRIVALIMIY